MKSFLLDYLICPACLPKELPLILQAFEIHGDDVLIGVIKCAYCGASYRIEEGIAILHPDPNWTPSSNKYETPKVVSSYLWSHYGDGLNDSEWIDAYRGWVNLIEDCEGPSLDIGCATGRFTFEMTAKSSFSVGIDLSFSFIRTSRRLMQERSVTFELIEEGEITTPVEIILPNHLKTENLEFVVADAMRLPLRRELFECVASLNIIDKLPNPLLHLEEMSRVAKSTKAQFLLSDPYSWSEEVTDSNNWLGGKKQGEFRGFGEDNVAKLIEGWGNKISPTWKITHKGIQLWKIRNHRNHYEFIKSRYLRAFR